MPRRGVFSDESDFAAILPLFSDFHEESKVGPKKWNFGLGDIVGVPHFAEVCEAAMSRMRDSAESLVGRLPGMQGHKALCERLAVLIEEETGLTTEAADVLLTDGGCDGIVLAVLSSCDWGDGVAYGVPSFPYWCVLQGLGIHQFPVHFRTPAEYANTFGTRMVNEMKANPSIQAVILNEPQNPMGVPLSGEQIEVLQNYAEAHDVCVIADDVGRGLAIEPAAIMTKFSTEDNVIIVDSFTKRFACPGLRLGFVRAGSQRMRSLRGFVANWRAGVGNLSAEFGFQILQELDARGGHNLVKLEIKRRSDELKEELRNFAEEYVCAHGPSWGIYCLLDFSPLFQLTGINGRDAVAYMRDNGVLMMDDSFLFPPWIEGKERENTVRLSIGGTFDVAGGMSRLIALVNSLGEGEL
jgi:aspartate/methionine/tyrosine aminotransferase